MDWPRSIFGWLQEFCSGTSRWLWARAWQPKCLSPLQLGSVSDLSKYILLHAINRVTSELVSPQGELLTCILINKKYWQTKEADGWAKTNVWNAPKCSGFKFKQKRHETCILNNGTKSQEITRILNENLMKTFQIYLAFTYSVILAEYIDQLAEKKNKMRTQMV